MNFREILERLTGGRPAWPDGTEGGPGSCDFDIALVIRLIVSCLMFAAALLFRSIPAPWPAVILILGSVIAGYDIIAGAVLSVLDGKFLDKTVLILLSALIAFVFGAIVEGAALILLFQLGGIFIAYAVGRTRMSALDAVFFENEYATVLREGGEDRVPSADVEAGERIRVRAGERIPCDCVVVEGSSSLDLSALGDTSGEVLAREGDELLSGSMNLSDDLICEVTSSGRDSTAAAMYRGVEHASASGEVVPRALEQLAAYFTPVVCVAAVLIAAILPLAMQVSVAESVRRAAVFLIIANPCALLVAAPLVRLCSAAGAARSGIFYKDSTAISSLAEAGAVAFSKPGTLTDGNPKVVSVKAERMGPEVLIKIAAHAMAYSNTPQARSIIAAYGGTIYIDLVQDFVEIPGSGVEVTVDGIKICVGTRDLMTVKHVSVPDSDLTEEYAVYVAIGDEYAGRITLNDNVRPDAASGVADLARCGVGKVVMFTDESRDSAAQAAASLGIVEYYSEHGIGRTREAIGEVRRGCASGEKLVFVGDPNCFNGTHTDADADVAMAGLDALTMPLGTDVTIVGGKVEERLPLAIAIAKYSEKLILCCAAGALLVKLALLALGFFGIATMWFAVFIDACAAVGASLASILAFSGESYSK